MFNLKVLYQFFACVLCVFSLSQASPIRFNISVPEDGFITLVLDSANTRRIRNLVSSQPVVSGNHTVQWNSETDEISFDNALQGVDDQMEVSLLPGTYTIRGMFRKDIDLRYEFTVYNSGNPPWETRDGTGQWLADHNPPTGAVYIPETKEIVLCAPSGESSPALIWIDSTGRKIAERDRTWGWKAAWCLTRDRVSGRIFAVSDNRFWELDGRSKKNILFTDGQKGRGIAVHGDEAYISYTNMNYVTAIDLAQNKVLGNSPIQNPSGCAFDSEGQFYILSGNDLLRGKPTGYGLMEAETLLTSLDEPHGLFITDDDQFFISEWGDKHTITIFNSAFKPIKSLGTPGPLVTGPYDSTHMQRPLGMALDSHGHLWVAEVAYIPKRVSVWDVENHSLIKAHYGPTKYGGGGVLDPVDTTCFYYAEERGRGTIEFSLDWNKGEARVKNLLSFYAEVPQTPHYIHGKRFLSNEHTRSPTTPVKTLHFYKVVNGAIQKVAIIGAPPEDSILTVPPLSDYWEPIRRAHHVFIYYDLNGNEQYDEGEFEVIDIPSINIRAMSMGRDYALTITGRNGVYRLPFSHLDNNDIPHWSTDSIIKISDSTAWTTQSLDGHQARYGSPLTGTMQSGYQWEYPSRWLNVQGSWGSPSPPVYSGEIIGATKFLYGTIIPRNSNIGELCAINGNMGNMYLLTYDGLMVATLFQDSRIGGRLFSMGSELGTGRGGWHFPTAERGMLLDSVSGGEEHFWPTITQTKNGTIYCTVGHEHSSLVRIDGLESCRRINSQTIEITPEDITHGQTFNYEITFDPITTQKRSMLSKHGSKHRFHYQTIKSSTYLVYSSPEPVMVKVFSFNGRMVSKKLVTEGMHRTLGLGQLTSGVYLVHVLGLHSHTYLAKPLIIK